MRKSLMIFIFLIFQSGVVTGSVEVMSIKGNRHISSFAEAKRVLPKIHSGHETTLYCGCKFYGKEVNMNSCKSYSPGQNSRFKKLEWEHVVPAQKLGQVIASWKEGNMDICKNKKGRKCATKASPLFRQMEGDLYNLWPESGGINGARSNKPPSEEVRGQAQKFGECETVVGKKEFVPRSAVRGEIARTYLYMADVYAVPLSTQERALFLSWNAKDPVDAWECERARRIQKVQGNANAYVDQPCKQRGL